MNEMILLMETIMNIYMKMIFIIIILETYNMTNIFNNETSNCVSLFE